MGNETTNITDTDLDKAILAAKQAKEASATTTTEPVVETPSNTVTTEVVETSVVETKVGETNVEKSEVIAETETVEVKKALDLLKNEEEEAIAPETKKEFTLADLPPEIQADIEYAKKLKSNPLLELFEKGATAEDLVEFAKSLVPTDNSTLPLSELIKKDFEQDLGLSGEDLDNAVKEYLEEVDTMPLWKQKQTEKAIRDKFKPSASDPNGFLSKWREVVDANKPAPQPTEAEILKEIETITATDKTQIAEIGNNLIGADFEGVKLTEAEVKAIVEDYSFEEVNIKYLGKDGRFNAKKYIQDKLQTSPIITQKRIEVAVAAERAKLLKEFGGVEKVISNGGDFKQGEKPINKTAAALSEILGINI